MVTDSPKIAALKTQYRASFPEKLALFNSLLAKVVESSGSQESRSDLHEYLHKLAGSSGMYGYENISALCRRLMDEVGSAHIGQLASELESLKHLLREDT